MSWKESIHCQKLLGFFQNREYGTFRLPAGMVYKIFPVKYCLVRESVRLID